MAACQRRQRRPVSDVLAPADQRVRRNPDVGEADVGGPCAFLTHLGVLDADIYARRVGGYQEDGDAGTLVVGGTGAREDDEQTSHGRIGDEAFLSVDHPICAVANGFRAQPRWIRSRARLRQRERRHHLTGGHRLQPARFLLVGAEPDEDLPGDAVVGPEHRPQGQRGVAQLHRQLDILREVQAQTTPFLRDRIAEQPHLLGLLAQVVGHPILGQNLLLARYDRGADEVTSLGQDVLEILVADFGGGLGVAHA
jgi:hypothetical protein